MTERVELRPAYTWTCPECGRDAFCTGVVPEMSPEELQELRSDFGIEPYDTGHFIMMPTEVTCGECGVVFETEHFGDEE